MHVTENNLTFEKPSAAAGVASMLMQLKDNVLVKSEILLACMSRFFLVLLS